MKADIKVKICLYTRLCTQNEMLASKMQNSKQQKTPVLTPLVLKRWIDITGSNQICILFGIPDKKAIVFVYRKCKFKPPGVHLTRFWSAACHSSFKHIPVPHTYVSNRIRDFTPVFQKYTRDLILRTEILKIDTLPCTNIVKIDALSNVTTPYPKCMECDPGIVSYFFTICIQ